ncbi:hypothetical protein [Methylobacterium radiodurans]|uniref:hypothetical protein n=1 Tax=Methylobacterium radiodurans TaxID=2202828 RepID=UPI001FE796F8|nr:hypothetical protein [Methylobacterium radiodurans]
MSLFSPDFCRTFRPGCSTVLAALAVMFPIFKSSMQTTAWFLLMAAEALWMTSERRRPRQRSARP